ncbi:DNA recombination and repair protein recO [Vibrio ishigakensis]|uniref:DNA recombination and repair protein recO n=1 Tax=Vibrio ishigakensis TaxID=1481914 RepID=A0A0B8QTV8_9VIBR|nr:DNA recombination and repair protein recO [Vibrio sp. JCM 19236]GAM77619.1 DNA recombination and repair protein recO [Vibrio ishigakensis]
MKTLRQAEPISLGLPLSGVNLYSAMYVNEILARVTAMRCHIQSYSSTICMH